MIKDGLPAGVAYTVAGVLIVGELLGDIALEVLSATATDKPCFFVSFWLSDYEYHFSVGTARLGVSQLKGQLIGIVDPSGRDGFDLVLFILRAIAQDGHFEEGVIDASCRYTVKPMDFSVPCEGFVGFPIVAFDNACHLFGPGYVSQVVDACLKDHIRYALVKS
jgi:hypothetical protein